ncbi:MAG: hypothetical protein L0216_08570 [Planctomycetales bacterium]|nr:hypothetical protein [Planctomycetales bacterium]
MDYRRSAVLAALAGAIATGAVTRPARAQESGPPRALGLVEGSLSGGMGATALGGTAHQSGGAIYDDLFGSGTMTWAAMHLDFVLLRRTKATISVGPWLQVDQTTYRGRTYRDSFGTALEPDEMTVTRGLLGGFARFRFGPPDGPARFWLGLQIGFGYGHSSEVDGDLWGPSTPRTRANLYESTDSLAWDFGFRLGLLLRADPHVDLGITAGFGGGSQGAPANASDPNLAPANAGPLDNIYAVIGLTLFLKSPSPAGSWDAPAPRYGRAGRGTRD